ncbi:MAG: glycosyltransferase [[Clostridium] cellulosi]|mgnify:CR=1 FL=1
MPAVSIIMPVYNSKKYLEQAVKSVTAQTFTDFELILVDDGSTDDSGTLCDKFAEQDSRIRVIHKENGGICSARNAGLDAASGDYIGFIDNDDEYDPNMLLETVSIMEKEKVDWVRFSRKRRTVYEDGSVKADSNGVVGIAAAGECVVLRSEKLFESYCKLKQSGALYGIWNALFRRDIIEKYNIRFDTSVRFGGEDWLFNIEYFTHVESVAFLGRDLYIYNRRVTHSTSTKYDFNRIEAVLKVVKAESEIIKNLQLKSYFEAVNLFLFTINCCECGKIMVHPKCSLSRKQKISIFKQIREELLSSDAHILKKAFKLLPLSKNKAALSLVLYLHMYSLFLLFFKIKANLKKEI